MALSYVYVYACVCMYAWKNERKREREKEWERLIKRNENRVRMSEVSDRKKSGRDSHKLEHWDDNNNDDDDDDDNDG